MLLSRGISRRSAGMREHARSVQRGDRVVDQIGNALYERLRSGFPGLRGCLDGIQNDLLFGLPRSFDRVLHADDSLKDGRQKLDEHR